jgi:hypothetical protein
LQAFYCSFASLFASQRDVCVGTFAALTTWAVQA